MSTAKRRGRAFIALVGGYAALLGCSREVELAHDTPPGLGATTPPPPEGGIPFADGAVPATDAGCAERPEEPECVGANDFQCGFGPFFRQVVAECHQESACAPRGWIAGAIRSDGCLAELGMTEPETRLLTCVADRFASLRCPCRDVVEELYLGIGSGTCLEP
ncbi:MAG: hypothetical protein IT376_21095 [Polyangiaceae bacterium]|nr:hypothetical protein [Polyangiaceae bacterium]